MASRKRRDKRRAEEQPRSVFVTYRLRPGTTAAEADELAGFIAAAVDDAASVYRARVGSCPFDMPPDGRVVEAEVGVATLH